MHRLSCEVVTGPRVLALRDLFHVPSDRPGAIASFLEWPTELDTTLAVPESTEEKRFRAEFVGAGCSRIVYAEGIAGGLAFKFNDIARYSDDNSDEQKADVPEWLTPNDVQCLVFSVGHTLQRPCRCELQRDAFRISFALRRPQGKSEGPAELHFGTRGLLGIVGAGCY